MKIDKELGYKVRRYLIKKGVETPMVDVRLNRDEKIELIQDNMKTIIEVLGLDTTDDSISGTANRVAKMYVDELCLGLDYNKFPAVTVFDNKMRYFFGECVPINNTQSRWKMEEVKPSGVSNEKEITIKTGESALIWIPPFSTALQSLQRICLGVPWADCPS